MAKILIADDNGSLLQLYAMEFEAEGLEVLVARDGAEALRICGEYTPDVVVLDIGMPEMDGLEALGELAAMNGGTPVVVNTAYPLFKMDYRSHRAAAWVEKSSRLDNLKAAVKNALSAAQKKDTES